MIYNKNSKDELRISVVILLNEIRGKMKLIHGDCLKEMFDIPDNSIDMVCCDMPYGILVIS